MSLKDYLNKYIGKGKNKLTKSDDGEIITVEKKQQLNAQKTENLRIETENKEKKANQDIREALALLNDSPTDSTSQSKKNKGSKLKQSAKSVKSQQPKPQSQHVDIDDEIDVPIDDTTIPPDYELHKHAAEAAALLGDPTSITYSKRRENIKHINKSQPKQKATGFDMDDI